ncbi:hypothetical protein A4S06_08835 [Erysipelotrichaceae bacterium MTC7]|nr:hypothetical protein A4S06_08835 [Erysipelotrichaceae bacterium MTC7]
MKKIAHCIHHTHWDLIWYFTAQDAAVQFSYNMKEILRGFHQGRIDSFFMDGQTAPIDEYLSLHPEDYSYMKELVSDGRLVIGPFNSQLDCFISSGESVINNLRLGIKTSKKLGKVSKVAYLPDSFGHSYDFPKIFNKFGIENFVITRGVGDEYGLDSEFYMSSNDGSKLLVYVMIAGYGYGCYGFKSGHLFEEEALDYNKISVSTLIERLLKYTTVKDEFVFPLGFDQNPAILDIDNMISKYNDEQNEYEFKSTTWEKYLGHVRKCGKNLKTHNGELYSTQYHRIHRTMFSARADIKAMQDKCERILTYELQPLMVMLDSLGIMYDHGILDKAWDTLIKCQTHSSATLTDETNDYIERETTNALNLVTSLKTFLMKLVSISLDLSTETKYPITIYNTLPIKRKMVFEAKVLTKTKNFEIFHKGETVPFTVKQSIRKNCGVLRKDKELINHEKFYFETDIVIETTEFNGISYKTYDVIEKENARMSYLSDDKFYIENEFYKIYQSEDGISIYDKVQNKLNTKAFYIEESGDEGDSFDYSYPKNDMFNYNYLEYSNVSYKSSRELQQMVLTGSLMVPSNLEMRTRKINDSELGYRIEVSLKKNSSIIEIKGYFDNAAEQHRVRLVFHGNDKNTSSIAGTQFSFIKRNVYQKEMKTWREDNWFEEPSANYPLLNHVSIKNDKDSMLTLFTRSSKEYELIGDGYSDLAITIFRSYGAMGYPDLNRRPGRPSGLDYMVFDSPKCQMKKRNNFDLSLKYYNSFDSNLVFNDYMITATETPYYQKQDFDKSINPIAYFPTNPLDYKLPTDYDYLLIDNLKSCFGSLVKSDSDNGYLLRMFNAATEKLIGGELCIHNSGEIKLCETDLIEQNENELNEMIRFDSGELKIIKIKKSEEKEL